MHALLQPVRDYVVHTTRDLLRGWNDFWFRPADPATLGMVRICTGLILLYVHLTCAAWILDFVGPEAWVDQEAIAKLRDPQALAKHAPEGAATPQALHESKSYAFSLWFWITNPTIIVILHSVFLLALLTFTLGLCSRISSIVVWMGHLSYIQRSHDIWFGMDTIVLMITLYLMFAPTGATLSLDRLIQRLRAARGALAVPMRGALLLDPPAQPSWTGNAVIRLIQVHMAIVYLWAGLSKLQGAQWWNGVAGYRTMMVPEFRIFSLDWLAEAAPDWITLLVSSFVTYFTLIFEIGFVFLVWNRKLRPLVLFSALLLHLGIGLFMGLGAFAMIMLTGCMAFVEPSSMRRFLEIVFKGRGGMRYVYERHPHASVSAAAVVRAADVFGQVTLVEANDSAVNAPAGSLLLPDGTVLKGASACGKLVRALRVLWLVWPLACLRLCRTEGVKPPAKEYANA
jgi:hypothetical protein